MFPSPLRWFGWALGFDFRTLLPPLLEDAVRRRESELSDGGGVCAYSRDAVGAHGSAETAAGALRMPPQVLVVYPPLAVPADASSRH